jgi:hypothetical protein
MQPQKFYIVTVVVIVDFSTIFLSHHVGMFVIYVCTKLHLPSSTRTLHTAIIKLTAKKAEPWKLCVLFCSVVLRQMQPMASPLLTFLYYLWTYGKTQTEDQPIKASTDKMQI